jgi:hypothetical protein
LAKHVQPRVRYNLAFAIEQDIHRLVTTTVCLAQLHSTEILPLHELARKPQLLLIVVVKEHDELATRQQQQRLGGHQIIRGHRSLGGLHR